jgi:hypothetical protein
VNSVPDPFTCLLGDPCCFLYEGGEATTPCSVTMAPDSRIRPGFFSWSTSMVSPSKTLTTFPSNAVYLFSRTLQIYCSAIALFVASIFGRLMRREGTVYPLSVQHLKNSIYRMGSGLTYLAVALVGRKEKIKNDCFRQRWVVPVNSLPRL